MNEWTKEVEKLRLRVEHLEKMLVEAEKTIIALRYDRNFYQAELARKGGNN